MNYFPLFFDLQDRPCLVVGGAETALRKVELLRKVGARLTVAAPSLEPTLAALADTGAIHHHPALPDLTLLTSMRLMIIADDDATVVSAMTALAREARVPVNVVDQPKQCDFIVPAIVDRDPITIAIGSGGAAPVLIRRLREKLESLIPARYGDLGSLMGRFRDAVKATLPASGRRRFWENVLDGPAAEAALNGDIDAAEVLLRQALDQAAVATTVTTPPGEVYLVGAGPGDPDLLTFRALRLMQQADVILYDRLVSPAVLERVRRDAERIFVGKSRSQHAVPQAQLNDLLVDLARQGKRVCRLKGGDPFIFGRGGEEMERLLDAGISCQVVPGITAAIGCGAYAGIPLTHRDYSQSVTFITGHRKADGELAVDWEELARPQRTVVFYMGLQQLGLICEQLRAHGAPAGRPMAIIENGTLSQQRVITGTLATLPDLAAAAEIGSPALIIMGEVVRLRERLAPTGDGQSVNLPAVAPVPVVA